MAATPILRRFALTLLLGGLGAVVASWLIPQETQAVAEQLLGFPDSDTSAHQLRPLLLGVLCFLPALATLLYTFAGTLDRYLTRQFATVFGLTITALVTLWILLDLSDKITDFRESDSMGAHILHYYGVQLPSILVLILPYGLLLALLYSLGKLSRTREIVAMVQTGRGIARVTAPLMICGLLLTIACTIFSYHWAPWAEGSKKRLLEEAKGEEVSAAENVLFYNTESRRLWKIGTFPTNFEKGAPLKNIEVTTTGGDRALLTRMSASEATWDQNTRAWTFQNTEIATFPPDNPPRFTTATEPVVQTGWKETPWQLIKPGLPAPYLGIPDLNTWLQVNHGNNWTDKAPYLTQWHNRWAQPAVCLITVLLAAPLGIVFTRRGASGGVAMAVFLCAGMIFSSTISLAFGESGYLPPWLAAWLPNIVFGILALILFQRRLSGRPIYQTIRRFLPGEE